MRGEIRNLEDKKLEQRLRSFWAAVIIILLILGGRLWELQIRQGDHYDAY